MKSKKVDNTTIAYNILYTFIQLRILIAERYKTLTINCLINIKIYLKFF